MPSFGVALAWIIISPLALLTDVLGVVIILHYKPLYHSCDVAFLSLLVTMATNSFLLLPIPAVTEMAGIYWSRSLCSFYTWLSITLRSAHLLVLLILNVYWMASLRVSQKRQIFTSSKLMKVSVCACWFISAIAGLVPAVDGGTIFDFYEEGTCKFLPASVETGYGIFFIIIALISAVMGAVSSLDSFLLFRSMKEVALTKYSAGRFHVPTVSGRLQSTGLVQVRYGELNVSLELCRLSLIFSIASTCVNSLPLMICQFVQLVQEYNRETMETTLLWLLLIESLTLPHLLWALSRRYRHATVYVWRVHFLRNGSIREDEPSSCAMQSYRLKSKEWDWHHHMNGFGTRHINGTAHRMDMNQDNLDVTNLTDETLVSVSNGRVGGQEIDGRSRSTGAGGGVIRERGDMSPDIVVELATLTHVPSSEIIALPKEYQLEGKLTRNEGRGYAGNISETPRTSNAQNFAKHQTVIKNIPENLPETVLPVAEKNSVSANSTSPVKTFQEKPVPRAREVKRSVSASSRTEWKERMRKKHLPAVIFSMSVEEDVENTPDSPTNNKQDPPAAEVEVDDPLSDISTTGRRQAIMSHVSSNWASTESTYYMSSDYHYDYLNDTLTKNYLNKNDNHEASYDDDDIGNVLDGSLANEASNKTVARQSKLDNISSEKSNIKESLTKQGVSHSVLNIDESGHSKSSFISQAKEGCSATYSERESSEPSRKATSNADNSSDGSTPDSEDDVSNDLPVGQNSFPSSNATKYGADFESPRIVRENKKIFLLKTNVPTSNEENNFDNEKKINDFHKMETGLNLNKQNIAERSSHQSHSDRSSTAPSVPSGELPNEARTSGRKRKEFTSAFHEHGREDYNKCETVSGTEMLLIKMKSLRSAMAFCPSDDTSDDGGFDNKGFEDDSSDDNHSQERTEKLSETTSTNLQSVDSRTLQKSLEVPSETTADKDTNTSRFSAAWTQDGAAKRAQSRSGNGDGEESTTKEKSHHNDDGIETAAVSKLTSPILKPPRLRKSTHSSSIESSEDENDSTFDDRSDRQYRINEIVDSVTSKEDEVITDLVTDDIQETDTSSALSVTVEPYGRRRPAWMDDSLLTPSPAYDSVIHNQATYGYSNDTSSKQETYRDSKLGSGKNGETNSGSFNELTYQGSPTIRFQNYLNQNYFGDNIDDDLDNNYSQDYLATPNFYRGMNLCFESIQEVPEEEFSGSETSSGEFQGSASASSQDTEPEANVNVGFTRHSTLPHSSDQRSQDSNPGQEHRKLQFATSERTSADGSEESPRHHSGHGITASEKTSPNDWSLKSTPKRLQTSWTNIQESPADTPKSLTHEVSKKKDTQSPQGEPVLAHPNQDIRPFPELYQGKNGINLGGLTHPYNDLQPEDFVQSKLPTNTSGLQDSGEIKVRQVKSVDYGSVYF